MWPLIRLSKLFFFTLVLTVPVTFTRAYSSFVTYAGNYKLGGCPPEAGNIIQQTINFLKPILFEPQFINPPAYQAFLGGVNPRIVQDIFTQVAGASEITVDGVVKRPEIWCISPQDMQNPLDETAKHCTAGGIVTYFDWIALCPIFFTFPLRGGVCAQVDAARTAMVSSFRQDQYSTLLVGLTYIYLSQKYREQTYALMQSEKNDLNTHISAKPKDKLISPWNYAYYAESILENCRDFPIPISPPAIDRELLETPEITVIPENFEGTV